jgi:glucosamine-6-phosphate deaminase
MGGTFIRLADQGHEVHVAYQTSGNTAVWDDEMLRYVEFAMDFAKSQSQDAAYLEGLYKSMVEFLKTKSCQTNRIPQLSARLRA